MTQQVNHRGAFAALVPQQSALEIGPFNSPLLHGEHVKYVDVYSTEELHEQAGLVGITTQGIPHIHWVAEPTDLSVVDETFDSVLSSHVIEHQPDFVNHLQQVEKLLNDGGRYFALVPDYRYCFDHFMNESRITDILSAHLEKRKWHSPSSLLESRLYMTHNDPGSHWTGNHGIFTDNPIFPGVGRIERLKQAMAEYEALNGELRNDHAWYFTPESFTDIIHDLRDLGLITFSIETMYPTTPHTFEFWVILKK